MTLIDKAEALAIVNDYWQSIGGGLPEGPSDEAILDTMNAIAQRIAAIPARGVGVAWHPFDTAPRGGEWFIARTEHGTTRVVRFADEYDRFPISHDGAVWPTAPTEWTPLKPILAAISPAPDAREAALHPDDILPEAIRLIRQEASRDHSQDVVTGLKHIALLLEQLIGEDRT